MITTTSSSKPYTYLKKNSILVVHVFEKKEKVIFVLKCPGNVLKF